MLPYGKSRERDGLRGRGSGSFGDAFAKAAMEDGFLSAKQKGLPPFSTSGGEGITWGKEQELVWSDGARIPRKWLDIARKFIIKSAAKVRNATEAREAIRNGYPLTIASDWGGMMTPPVKEGVRLNRRVTKWMHQMCVIGWWNHPVLGEIFYVLNSWGVNAHGEPAGDEPPGGFWVQASEIDYIARQGDTFAFSRFDGFPGNEDPNFWRW